MKEYILFFSGMVFSGVVVLLYYRSRMIQLQTLLKSLKGDLENKEKDVSQLESEAENLLNQNIQLKVDNKSISKELELVQKQIEKETTEYKMRMEKEANERQKLFNNQLQLIREQMTNVSVQLLNARSDELYQANTTQMNSIITPLMDSIKRMQEAMDSNRDQNNKNTASLEEQIKLMLDCTKNVGLKADSLAEALRNENKTQGNWGELVLSELLSNEGLEQGIHFDIQTSIRNEKGELVLNEETGKRMIPDVILHYPDKKDIIVDSKVSLSAFLDYFNGTSEEEKHDALMRHLESIRKHVRELSNKQYERYLHKGHSSLGYVIMFIPNESALQLALINDSRLWRDAFERGVFITSGQNLIAALRLIKLAWIQYQQSENQEQVYKLAGRFLDRLGDFSEKFSQMGKSIDALQHLYKEADNKLRLGKQSLLVPAKQLVELGAKENGKRPLPNIDTDLSDFKNNQ